jgi:hypothetical protein
MASRNVRWNFYLHPLIAMALPPRLASLDFALNILKIPNCV